MSFRRIIAGSLLAAAVAVTATLVVASGKSKSLEPTPLRDFAPPSTSKRLVRSAPFPGTALAVYRVDQSFESLLSAIEDELATTGYERSVWTLREQSRTRWLSAARDDRRLVISVKPTTGSMVMTVLAHSSAITGGLDKGGNRQ